MAYKRKLKRLVTCKYEYCDKQYWTQYKKLYCTTSHREKQRWHNKYLKDKGDLVACLVCNAKFVQVGTHVVQVHGYESAREYRLDYGLDYKRGVVPSYYRKLKGEQAIENGTYKNLIKGSKFRFKKGGRSGQEVKKYWRYKQTGTLQ